MRDSVRDSSNSCSGALVVGAGILFSRIAGLIRERVFAYFLGNSDAAGAFRAALRIPNLLQNLFGEGSLSASFIPVYSRLLAEGKKEEAASLANVVLTSLAIVVALMVALGVSYSPFWTSLLAPGFQDDVREATVRLVQIMFPGMGLLVLSAWCLGILNSHRQFFLAYVAPVLWNIAIIATLFGFGFSLMSSRGDQFELVAKVAWGTVAGAFLQFAVQLPAAWRLNHSLRFEFFVSENIRKVFFNFIPALLSRGVVQFSAYVDQVLASFLGAQAVSAMAYTQTLTLLPISLFGMSISSAELPVMSRATGTEEERERAILERLRAGVERLIFYIVPSAAAFLFLGDVIAGLVFQTGHFSASDSKMVWWILAGGTVGLLATTQSRLYVSAFWALHDTRTPAVFSFFRVMLTAGLGLLITFPLRARWGWTPTYAAAALNASAGLAGWIEFWWIKRALKKRLGPCPSTRLSLGRAWLAALVAASIAFGLHWILGQAHPFFYGVLVLGCYGGGYLCFAHLFGMRDARELYRVVARRFRLRNK